MSQNKLKRSINTLFYELCKFIKEKNDNASAFIVLFWLEKVAAEFKVSELEEAKYFNSLWLNNCHEIKKLAKKDEFKQLKSCLEEKLSQIICDDKRELYAKSKENGDASSLILAALDFIASN